jgi:4-azaleucine resistance transporter AzlC
MCTLTDETFSLVCNDNPGIPEKERKKYYLYVSLLNHIYWVTGSVIGAVAGSFAGFNSEGIDFALTALFITVFIEQWLTNKRHSPAIIGVAVSVVCLLIFGKDNFLIPAMLVMLLLLCVYKEGPKHE